ncbi:uncharacterized protein LOC62_04G006055 [Vanrija pseudolonga]|uniref:Uncharacterized protein n=1 Tax=Vanrija pseudolonga TaxID=143232 RepID=A0AAF1BJC2_9TREE|nr:hypothetical protein LOC62_04G006055 [Vanrija pseudolonga]
MAAEVHGVQSPIQNRWSYGLSGPYRHEFAYLAFQHAHGRGWFAGTVLGDAPAVSVVTPRWNHDRLEWEHVIWARTSPRAVVGEGDEDGEDWERVERADSAVRAISLAEFQRIERAVNVVFWPAYHAKFNALEARRLAIWLHAGIDKDDLLPPPTDVQAAAYSYAHKLSGDAVDEVDIAAYSSGNRRVDDEIALVTHDELDGLFMAQVTEWRYGRGAAAVSAVKWRDDDSVAGSPVEASYRRVPSSSALVAAASSVAVTHHGHGIHPKPVAFHSVARGHGHGHRGSSLVWGSPPVGTEVQPLYEMYE